MAKPKQPEAPPAPQARWTLIALAVIALVGLLLRLVHIGDPAAGFHLFNEGFYTSIAEADLSRGLFAWLVEPGDLINPPFYTLVVTTFFRVLGPSLLVARLVSVLSGVGAVVLTFLIGKTMFTERIGLVGAAVLAVMPGAVLINHNAQVDSLLVALELGAIYCYVLAIKRKNDRLSLLGGALLGLAFITKLPAVLVFVALAAWETWRTHGLGWLKKRRVWFAVAGFAAAGLPWHLVQLAVQGQAYLNAQAGVGSSFMAPNSTFWSLVFARELSWMHWPPFWLFVVGALVYVAWKRESGDKLAIAVIGANLLFYVFYHFHTYYLLPIAPFTALVAARGIDAIFERKEIAGRLVLGVSCVALAIAALVTLGGNKVGLFSPAEIEPALGARADGAELWVDYAIWANFGPAVDMYVPSMTLQKLPDGTFQPTPEQLTEGKSHLLLTLYIAQDPVSGAQAPAVVQFNDRPHELVLFGVSISQDPPNRHLMANGPWKVDWDAHPLLTFGLKPKATPLPGPIIYDLDELYATTP